MMEATSVGKQFHSLIADGKRRITSSLQTLIVTGLKLLDGMEIMALIENLVG